jgi:hypothetical protein
MKLKFSFFFLLTALCAQLSQAQGVMKFAKDTHEFGNVEEGVQATHEFEFTNTGKTPVIISNVSASCGCTTPFWTKEPVAPGKKGKITASYNSSGRPGAFHKTITVTSNAEPATQVLTIKGAVVPKTDKPVTPEQIASSPTLQLDKSAHNFGKLEKGQLVSQKFTITNTGKSELQIDRIQSACACVSYSADKLTLAPGEKTVLELKYNPRTLQQQNEIVTLYSNDLKTPGTQITLQANVVESLSSQNMLKEQKTAVPFK